MRLRVASSHVAAQALDTSGTVLGTSGTGHAGSLIAHVHFSVRLDEVYVDPLGYLSSADISALIRLAPLA